MHSFEDISQTDRATASVEVITSMQCDMNDEAVELDYGCNEIGFSESDCPRKAEPDSAKQESSQTADNNNLNGVDLEEGEVVEVEDGEILEDSEVRSEQDSMCRLLPERNLEGRRDVFGTGKQNFHDHFGWKKDECRRNSSSPYQSRFAGRVSRPQEASGTIADEAWKRGLETARTLMKKASEKRETNPKFEDKKIRLLSEEHETQSKESTRRSSQDDDQEVYRSGNYNENWCERTRKNRSASRSPLYMYRDEPHGLLTTSEHHRVDMSPKGRGYTYGGEKHDWERRYDRGKGERYQSSSYNRERSRPLPYVRTLQDEMDWRDPWQRPISPGRNKRSLCASNSADVRQCYGRSRSSTSSGSSETTDSKIFHRKRKLHKRRRRSVTKGRRSSSADSFSSISSDHKAKGLSRNTSFGRSHSKSSTADKEPEESPRDLVRTIFAEKKQMKLSSSMHQSSDESPSESLEESRKSVSSECSDSCHSTGLGEFTTEDEITADLDEEDNQDLKDVRREDLVRKIRMIEAEIEKRRSRLSTRND